MEPLTPIEKWCPEVTQGPQGSRCQGTPGSVPSQAGWDPQGQGAPTGMQSCKVTPCLHELLAPVSPPLYSQKPRTREGGSIPTSHYNCFWTRDASWCLYGVGRAELCPAEGDEEPASADLQREHSGTAAPGLIDMVAPQCPSHLPVNIELPEDQPNNLGGICGWGPVLWGDVLRASSNLHRLLPPSGLHFCGHIQQLPPAFLPMFLKHQQENWGRDGDTCPHLPHLFILGLTFTLALSDPFLYHHHWHPQKHSSRTWAESVFTTGRKRSGRQVQGLPGQESIHMA